MATIGPLLQLYEEDIINQQGFRDACKSPALPREQRRFLGLQYLRYFNEDVTEAKLDAFLEGSEVPWEPPAPIGELTMEEKRTLIDKILKIFGAVVPRLMIYPILFRDLPKLWQDKGEGEE